MRPNILMVVCHDLGQHLGCYGNISVETSNIDSIAEEGLLFKNYFATAPLCSPSRGSIMTGRYPGTTGFMGLVNRGWELSLNEKTLPQYLKEAGYSTYLFGFQHERRDPVTLGYDYVAGWDEPPHLARKITPKVVSFLEGDIKEPFFACVGFFEVHRPWEFYQKIDPKIVKVPDYLPDTPEVREDLAMFYGSILETDYYTGKILETLKRSKIEDNTIFIFTTDHGIAFPRAKSTLYDPGIKTTLILRWVGGDLTGGKVYDQLLSNVDLLPTILDILEMDIPESIQGISFKPLLYGKDYKPRSEIFAQKDWHDIYDPIRCIRTDRFKYIRNYIEGVWPYLPLPLDIEESLSRKSLGNSHIMRTREKEELYDLSIDPLEINNLSSKPEYRDILDELRSRLYRWQREINDPILQGPIPVPGRGFVQDPVPMFEKKDDGVTGKMI
ncbi:MAG TPA: sulfatase [bacterium]|nr:sulfatase [bacterium]